MKEIKNLEEIVDEVLAEDTAELLDVKRGIRESLNHLVAEVMKRSGGRADPNKIRRLIINKI